MSDKSLNSVLENVTQPSAHTQQKAPQKKLSLKAQREKDNVIIRGKFHFHECPGGMLEFVYNEYKEDPIRRYRLQDGQIYNLPRGVARHINKNVAYPAYEHFKGGQGNAPFSAGVNPDSGMMDMRIKSMQKRASFESLEFLQDDDISGPLVETVEFLPIK